MAMTEAEALTKLCPFSHAPWLDGQWNERITTINRTNDGGVAPGCNCMASGCMMWTWAAAPADTTPASDPTKPPPEPEPEPTTGYCGLAPS